MAKKTVYRGQVLEPYQVIRPEEGKGKAVWFYANRGNFEFLVQDSENGICRQTLGFTIPTRTLRAALRLVGKKS